MNRFVTQLLSIFLITSIFAATHANTSTEPPDSFTPHKITTLKWGKKIGQVALTPAPANHFGPASVAADDTSVYLLDAANQRIVVINLTNQQFSSIDLRSDEADDFCMMGRNRFLLLYRQLMQLRLYHKNGKLVKTLPIPKNITPIGIHQCPNKKNVMIETDKGEVYQLYETTPLPAIPIGHYSYSIARNSATQWVIWRHNKRTQMSQEISIVSQRGTLATINLIGIDKQRNLYLNVEEVIDEGLPSQKIARQLRKYTPTGKWVAEVKLPDSLYAYTLKDLTVAPTGDVFQIVPLPNGLELVKWTVSPVNLSKGWRVSPKISYRQQLFSYPKSRPKDFEPSETPDNDKAVSDEPGLTKRWGAKLTRPEIIKLAQKYSNDRFYVNSTNITRQGGEYQGNKVVITPISTPGPYIGVPYKWGGNDSPDVFQSGLNHHKKAGDQCTAKHPKCRGQYFGSSGAVGIDCSGFISQLWGLSQKYSTRSLPSISTQLSSMNELQPGDIINKPGHVRLFSHKDAYGRFFVYEASARDWKVSGRFYRLSQLINDGYKPYRYKWIDNQKPEPVAYEPVNLYIFGQPTLAERQSTAYTAKLLYNDGRMQDVTRHVHWTVNSPEASFNGSMLQAHSINQDKSVYLKATYRDKDYSLTRQALVKIRNVHDQARIEPPKDILTQIKQLQVANASVRIRVWLDSVGGKPPFSSKDWVRLYYQFRSSRVYHAYLTVFNISPRNRGIVLINNEKIEVGKRYRFPKTTRRQPGQIVKNENRLYLETGQEYFKAVVTKAPMRWTTFFEADSRKGLQNVLGTQEMIVNVD